MHDTDHGHTICRLPGEASVEAMLSSHPATRTAIVFVHGFAGNAVSTWSQFQRLVDEAALDDAWWRTADLYFYGYAGVSQTTNQSATDLLRFMERVFPAPQAGYFIPRLKPSAASPLFGGTQPPALRDAPHRYDELVLVGHSEGGVVLRLALRELAREHDKRHRAEPGPPATGVHDLLARSRAEGGWDAARWVSEAEALAGAQAPPPAPLLTAALRLFAPAISGAAPSGVAGVVYHSFIGAVVRPFLSGSSAFNDLQPGSSVLAGLRSETERYAERYPQLRALAAHILWGKSDGIVTDESYAPDRADTEAGKSHTAVCKPTPSYCRPLDFVQRGLA